MEIEMRSIITANEISGRAIGSLFFIGFGAAWIITALYVKQILSAGTVCCVVLGLAVLLPSTLWLYRQSKRFPKTPEDRAMRRAFNRINAIQWIAIGLACFTLGRLHLDVYAVSAVATIVGLHLFPLARLFRYPMHYATAIALVVWAGVGLLLVPIDQLQGTTALGTGIILWLSAAISLAVGARKVMPAFQEHACS
jgi:hypothetical protein